MVQRNVFFYEVRPGRFSQTWQLDVPGLIRAIDAMDDQTRMVPVDGPDGDSYEFVQVVDRGGTPSVAYVRCRDHGLPMLAQAVDLQPLSIAADQQLAELTHIVFLDKNIIGAEYNHYGPRVTPLANYLRKTVPNCLPDDRRVKISPILDIDPLETLRGAKVVRWIDLTMAPIMMTAINSALQLAPRDTLEEMSRSLGAQSLQLGMRNGRGLDKDQAVALLTWAFEQGPDILDAAHAQVEHPDGTRQNLNLLNTRVTATCDMELMGPNARSISHTSARDAIVSTYERLADQIRKGTTTYANNSIGQTEFSVAFVPGEA